MAAAIKMDELLVSWLGNDDVYENVMDWIENYRAAAEAARIQKQQEETTSSSSSSPSTAGANTTGDASTTPALLSSTNDAAAAAPTAGAPELASSSGSGADASVGGAVSSPTDAAAALSSSNADAAANAKGDPGSGGDQQDDDNDTTSTQNSPRGVIPPFYPPPPLSDDDDDEDDEGEDEQGAAEQKQSRHLRRRQRRLRRRTPVLQHDTWEPLPETMLRKEEEAQNKDQEGPLSPKQQAASGDNNELGDSSGDNEEEETEVPKVKPLDTTMLQDDDDEDDEDDDEDGNAKLQAAATLEEGGTADPSTVEGGSTGNNGSTNHANANSPTLVCVRDQVQEIYLQVGQDPPLTSPMSVLSEGDDSAQSCDDTTNGSGGNDSSGGGDIAGGGSGSGDNNKNNNAKNNLSSSPGTSSPTGRGGGGGNGAGTMMMNSKYLTADNFVRITKEVCRFPSFFNVPLYQRILDLWNCRVTEPRDQSPMEVVTLEMLEWYWKREMEPYDPCDRFFRLVKQMENDFIVRDDFLPFIKALLSDHPGLEFLTTHAEFQEKYAVTVITRIFYCVNKCHSGRITSRQVRRSQLLEAFQQVDEEEDINKVTRYFSYEHFYVLYCRFWELDHDRDYRITRDDLLKYGDHSLSHMIVDRIFDAAPRPFEQDRVNRDFLSYEDFIYFMLSEEDKANEVSVRYWFACVDVDGDGKLNNMEMRSFYAVQLHRMQCMGHEIVPFEDMLCQMMDMIKPSNPRHLVAEDFLQVECCQVSGALFDALFNLNKYLMFEQRDPFAERQKREDEFECDWDRFACIDYNRLAMEEEAREEEAMEIDWVTVDDEDDVVDGENFGGGAGGAAAAEAAAAAGAGGGAAKAAAAAAGKNAGSSEAPF